MQWAENYPWTDAFKAIEIPQPYADEISRGERDIAIASENTDYRGDLLIVSTPGGERGGMVVGRVELVSVKKRRKNYIYCLKNPRRMIEFPCQKCEAKGDIWDVFYTKGVLEEYPTISLRWLLKKHKII